MSSPVPEDPGSAGFAVGYTSSVSHCKAKVGTQTLKNVVGVGSSQFLTEKVLDIVLDVKSIDFLHLCNAMMLLCIDQEIQGIVVISLDCPVSQPPKLTIQFELFSTVLLTKNTTSLPFTDKKVVFS